MPRLTSPRSLGFGNSHVSARAEVSVSDLPDCDEEDSASLSLFDSPDGDSDED